VPKAAEAAALVGRAKTLRGIVQNEHPLGFGNRCDRIVIRGLPEQINRNDRFRLEPALLGDRDAVFQRIGIDIERRFIDIDEDGRGAKKGHHLAGRAERKGRTDHSVARTNLLCHQHHQQRVGAAGAGDHMFRAAEGRKVRLQSRNFRPVDELAMRQHARDRIIDALAATVTLLDDVDERDSLSWRVLIHAIL